jgi:hypothetical protein
VTEGGAILDRKGMLGFLGLIYGLIGFTGFTRTSEIHTPDARTSWALVKADWKDLSVFPDPAEAANVPGYLHSIRMAADGKVERIVQLGTSVERYELSAKFSEFLVAKVQELGKAGTGA